MEAPEAISEVGEPVAAVMPAECVTLDQKVYWHVSNGLGSPAGIAKAIAATTGDVLMSLMTLAYFGKVEKDPEDYTRLWRVA